jgi:zinc transport system ATP-binding protein
MKSIIRLENISFSYQDAVVLEDVAIQVQQGEFMGIFGPNGGGKTTLLRLIMGFLKPQSGEIKVLDKSPAAARDKISYVPQGLRFDRQFPISVSEVVLSGRLASLPWYGKFSPEDIDKAEGMIAKVGLADMRNRAFGTLSGGQAQRTLIARALVSDPEILLLDEPTASVDAKAEIEIYKFLEELRGKITILMVTHHLRTAIEQVDRVLLVRKNVVSLLPEEVCEHFAIGLYHPPLMNIKK